MFRKLLFVVCMIGFLSACGQAGEENINAQNENNNERSGDSTEVFSEGSLETNVDVKQEEGVVLFDIGLVNKGKKELELTFPSSQHYEIVVLNEVGEEVYRYSEGEMFTQAIVTKTLATGDELEFHDEWQMDKTIQSGTYTVKVEWKVSEINGQEVSSEALIVEKKVQIQSTNTAFRNIEVTGEDGSYTVTGEARVFEGSFFYSVEEGHEYLIEETNVKVQEGAPNWTTFDISITIPKEDIPVNGTLTMELYERSAKDGTPTNIYLVKLEQIKKEVGEQ